MSYFPFTPLHSQQIAEYYLHLWEMIIYNWGKCRKIYTEMQEMNTDIRGTESTFLASVFP